MDRTVAGILERRAGDVIPPCSCLTIRLLTLFAADHRVRIVRRLDLGVFRVVGAVASAGNVLTAETGEGDREQNGE